MADRPFLSAAIVEPLLALNNTQSKVPEKDLTLGQVSEEVLCQNQQAHFYEEILKGLLSGQTVLFLDGAKEALLCDTYGVKERNVQEPETEASVRGPREGFVERIGINASLLRSKLKDEKLRFEPMVLGKRSHTLVYITYFEGLANPKLVEEVRRRLNSIDIDAILESGYIEQLIEDGPFSIFPTVGATEKPDKLAAKLLEGRVGIMVDGTPFVLTVPYLLVEAFQNPEDYYARPFYASVVRLIRYLAFYITTMLPAFYVAIQTFHQEMVPTHLLIKMSAGREGIPFPVIVEALGMGIMFELLREAGIRMPRSVGQAVSIVGALVIGEAAVQAGFISQSMVIIVALTAISGFLVPPLTAPASLLRFYFLISTSFLGLFGWLMALIALLIHLASLRSFGVPYLSPLMPTNVGDLKDGFIRAPLWMMITRPSLLNSYYRQKKGSMPKPQKNP